MKPSAITVPIGFSVASRDTAGRGADDASERSMLSVGPSLITQSGTPTDEQFEDIRSRFGDPRATHVTPENYYVFRLIASGNGLDSYYTRHDTATSYPNMVRDLHRGQSLLGSHKADTFSYGSSFDGQMTPADTERAEYEPTFYPQWDSPDLRTTMWLVGDYFMSRGMTVNGESTNDLVLGIETGAIRKVSVSFMVGSYVCGIDGRDLVPTMFGPMPDEECNHFPGIAYEDGKGGKQIAWALMKNNTLVETSLVYKNASPSSMLLRKAENLAERGLLSGRDIDTVEARLQVRLPRFGQRVWAYQTTSATANTANVRFDAQVQEENDMANRRRGGNDAARDVVRDVLTAAPEPEDELTPESEAAVEEDARTPDPETTVSEAAAESEAPEAETSDTQEAAAAEAVEEAPTEGTGAEETDDETEAEPVAAVSEAVPGASLRHKGHSHTGPTKGGHLRGKTDEEAEPDGEAVAEEEGEADTETSGSTREEEAVTAFVAASDRLVSGLARNADAFDSGLLSMAARAEKAIDLALIDAGCDVTVGSQVYRSFEIRSKKMTEALGEPLTVEAIRTLQSKAQLGDELFRELVKDAVAARIGAQGETFNADRYGEVLLGTRDVPYVKDEIASYKAGKQAVFTPGRQVVPRQPVDAKVTKDERKALPESPAATAAKPKSTSGQSASLIQPQPKTNF